jgi:hypothetical protein
MYRHQNPELAGTGETEMERGGGGGGRKKEKRKERKKKRAVEVARRVLA